MSTIKVKNVDKDDKANFGKVENWSIEKILSEINRDRSELWTPYNSSDWREGWAEWVQHDGYYWIDPNILKG